MDPFWTNHANLFDNLFTIIIGGTHMKNTDFSAYRFPNEYIPYGKEWNSRERFFAFENFRITAHYGTFSGWHVTLADTRTIINHGNPMYNEAIFHLPSDRAMIRFIRLMERYSTSDYLSKATCPTLPYSVTFALENEFSNLVKRIERFCHSIGGYTELVCLSHID